MRPSVTKGGSITGTITASAAPTQNITINLASSNSKQATVPATITLLAGQTTATFVLSAVQDTVIDGTQLVTVSAAVDDWTTGYKSIAILDDNNYVIVVLPTGGFEGQTFTNGGTVSVGGTLTTALTVNLSSNDPSQISIPSRSPFPRGQARQHLHCSGQQRNQRPFTDSGHHTLGIRNDRHGGQYDRARCKSGSSCFQHNRSIPHRGNSLQCDHHCLQPGE